MQLHPIMYVADQYAEREFYELFGFERHYEGEEFLGFWRSGRVKQSSGCDRRRQCPAYSGGLRWQFELAGASDLDDMIGICRARNLRS